MPLANPDKRKAYTKAYRQRNAIQIKAYQKAYRERKRAEAKNPKPTIKLEPAARQKEYREQLRAEIAEAKRAMANPRPPHTIKPCSKFTGDYTGFCQVCPAVIPIHFSQEFSDRQEQYHKGGTTCPRCGSWFRYTDILDGGAVLGHVKPRTKAHKKLSE